MEADQDTTGSCHQVLQALGAHGQTILGHVHALTDWTADTKLDSGLQPNALSGDALVHKHERRHTACAYRVGAYWGHTHPHHVYTRIKPTQSMWEVTNTEHHCYSLHTDGDMLVVCIRCTSKKALLADTTDGTVAGRAW